MRTLISVVVSVLVYFIIAGSSCKKDPVSSDASGSNTISGHVSGIDMSFENVYIYLTGSSIDSTWVHPDSSGNYKFNDIPEGTYEITPFFDGYIFDPPSSQRTLSVDNTAICDFEAMVGSKIVATIYMNQSGFANVEITIRNSDNSWSDTMIDESTGRYHCWIPAVGTYTLTPSMEGYTFDPDIEEFTLTEPDTLIYSIYAKPISSSPVDIQISSDVVSENQPVGTIVGTFSTVDPDAGDSHTYALVAGDGDSGNGSFTIENGNELRTAEVFDQAAQSNYSIRVRTTDNADNFFEKVFSITIAQSGYQGVYAELTVHRSQNMNESELSQVDIISARFDSLYAPDTAIKPMKPIAIYCKQQGAGGDRFDLEWLDGMGYYFYNDIYQGHFLAPGTEYFFAVTGGSGVPILVSDSVLFPECSPYITNPEPFSFVELDGLELTWENYDTSSDCDRPVTIRIMDLNADWTDVSITTENDGSYIFTSEDVSGIDPYTYQLQIVLVIENTQYITAMGYDPRSSIIASTYATQIIYLEQ